MAAIVAQWQSSYLLILRLRVWILLWAWLLLSFYLLSKMSLNRFLVEVHYYWISVLSNGCITVQLRQASLMSIFCAKKLTLFWKIFQALEDEPLDHKATAPPPPSPLVITPIRTGEIFLTRYNWPHTSLSHTFCLNVQNPSMTKNVNVAILILLSKTWTKAKFRWIHKMFQFCNDKCTDLCNKLLITPLR